jgi:hypothetical protein
MPRQHTAGPLTSLLAGVVSVVVSGFRTLREDQSDMIIQWQGQPDNGTTAAGLGNTVPGVFDAGGVRPGSFGYGADVREGNGAFVRDDIDDPDPDDDPANDPDDPRNDPL